MAAAAIVRRRVIAGLFGSFPARTAGCVAVRTGLFTGRRTQLRHPTLTAVPDVASSVSSKTLGSGHNRIGAPVSVIVRSRAKRIVQPTSTTSTPTRSDRRSSNQTNGSAATFSISSILAGSISPGGADDAGALVTTLADCRREDGGSLRREEAIAVD